MKKYDNDKEKKIYEELKEKEQEIELLKQQLNQYKQFDKIGDSDSHPVNRPPIKRREYHVPKSNRASKSPEIRQPDEKFSFQPQINTKSRKILRSNDV
jgi:hypothetical protein